MALLKFSRVPGPVTQHFFEVQMFITDPENHPIPNVAGRIVLGREAGWEKANNGERFETRADGRTAFAMAAQLHEGLHRRPTNFLDSLFGRKKATDDLQIAAELVYAGESLLYVAQLIRFRCDGTVLLGEVDLFSTDAQGDFTVRVPRSKEGGWLLPQLGGFAVTNPGHEIADFLYQPDESDPSGTSWILKCQFKRWPSPVRRE